MEGNACYKLSTVRNYLKKTGVAPIRTAIDVGCHVGEILALIRFQFPECLVFGFEPVEEYYRIAIRRMECDSSVKVFQAAVCGLHRFEDDLGHVARLSPVRMRLARGREGAGPGWRGGSVVFPETQQWPDSSRYVPTTSSVHSMTLDELVTAVMALTGREQIDYLKMDCEGCECDALGCASRETLSRIRFIGGEYHDIRRFYKVMSEKLLHTHYVSLLGTGWGSFFCERVGESHTILDPRRVALELPPQLTEMAIDCNPFREEFVLPHERLAHGLA